MLQTTGIRLVIEPHSLVDSTDKVLSCQFAIGERETEVATLQANGVGRSWIRRAITAENLVTVGMGLLPGLLLGWLSAGLFIRQFSTDQFQLDPVLHPVSLMEAVALITVCALVAQVPGLRRLDRLDLATKVRERAL